MAIFNFQYKVWTDITCTMATLFDKQTRPRVVVVFNELSMNTHPLYKNTLYSVDLNLYNDANWKQESIWFQAGDQMIGM